jgi:hypothetical protein
VIITTESVVVVVVVVLVVPVVPTFDADCCDGGGGGSRSCAFLFAWDFGSNGGSDLGVNNKSRVPDDGSSDGIRTTDTTSSSPCSKVNGNELL